MGGGAWTQQILDLYEYYRYKDRPTQTQLDQWNLKIEFIPFEARAWIINDITNNDKLPLNLPKAIITSWFNYRKANTDKTIAEPEQYCDDCYGHGTHIYEKLDYDYDPPIWVAAIAACSRCDNSKRHFGKCLMETGELETKGSHGNWRPDGRRIDKIWQTTKQEIIDKGFEYKLQHNSRAEKVKAIDQGEVSRLIDGLFKRVEKKGVDVPKRKIQLIEDFKNSGLGDA